MTVTWEEPPAATGQTAEAHARAAELRDNPGRWARIRDYPLDAEGRETPAITAAAVYASTIRMGKVRWAEPAGAFEAVRRQVEDGWAVYARFVGKAAKS